MSWLARFGLSCVGLCLVLPTVRGEAPLAPREFRAAWVATVENIDWPSKPGLTTGQQKAEIDRILDVAADLNMNAIVLQVRTTADAFYDSKLEPWSVYLTGKQGVAPEPYYDPLEYWIAESHARGIELHAWLNPYRAQMKPGKVAASHVSKTMPDSVQKYGRYLWLDPGSPRAANHSLSVFSDIVRRYDIDGIHMDDYFYPYPIVEDGKKVPFPDDAFWAKYRADGGTLSRDDWRRANINDLIQTIYETTHAIKPHVRFGISPFGIGRGGVVPGITGFDQYEELYADAALWLNEGWCDYFTPQLYWPIAQKAQSFPVLLDYWRRENSRGRYVWPGLYTSRVGEPEGKFSTTEIGAQIEVTRQDTEAPGHVHFSMKALLQNRDGLADSLQANQYANDALIPTMPWLDNESTATPIGPPAKPKVTLSAGTLKLQPGDEKPVWLWGVWSRVAGNWNFEVLPGKQGELQANPSATQWTITAVDRLGNESPRVSLAPGR